MKINKTIYIKFSLLAILIYFPIFQHLGDCVIELWDESRLGINALEMLHNKNYLVTYFNNSPDMWNTKPPFLIWCQVLSLHLFGWNEITLRLPSAFAVLTICLLLFYFFYKKTYSKWLGSIAIIVLLTSNGFMLHHTGRSANYDAMLSLFLFCAFISFYLMVENNKTKYYYWFFASITLAVLTKSIAGLFLLPACLFYIIYQNKILQVLKNKHFYFGLLLFVGIIFGYYYMRELHNPGYLKAVLENEIGGRFLKVNEGHEGNFWSHFYEIKNEGLYTLWFWCLPIGATIGFFNKNKTIKNISIFASLVILTFYCIISSSKTILGWYSMPMYPFMAILIALCNYTVFNYLMLLKNLPFTYNFFPYLFIFLVFAMPYIQMFNFTNRPLTINYNDDEYKTVNLLRHAINENININNYTIIWKNNVVTNFMFYSNKLKEKNNININYKTPNEVEPNDTIIVSNNDLQKEIERKYTLTKIKKLEDVNVFVSQLK